MAPDLSEKLLGIDIDDADGRKRDADGANEDVELVRFVFVGVGEHRLALPVDAVRTITEAPSDLTRVPRAPRAVEGLVDLRGEITAVIDPTVLFPTTESRDGRERLLVLDRPNDEQSAAIRVDDVIGVEAVPEDRLVDETGVDDRPISGGALEHPLVVALIEQERTPDRETSSVVASAAETSDADVPSGAESMGSTGTQGVPAVSSVQEAESRGDSIGESFDIEPDDAEFEEPADDSAGPDEIVVEATAVIDIDTFLLAAGQRT